MKQRNIILTISSIATLTVSLFAVLVYPLHLSYSLEDPSQTFENALSSSDGTIITVVGESTQRIETDQVTLDVSIPTPPSDMSSTIHNQNNAVRNLVDAITSSMGPNGASISVGQQGINPYYMNGNSLNSSLFTAYTTIPIKTDFDHFSDISSSLSSAGFRMDTVSVSQVPVTPVAVSSSASISITSGSGASATADCVSTNDCFTPNPISVKPGTQVTWKNDDKVAHTVTSGKPSDSNTGTAFDSGLIKPGQTSQFTFQNAGTYDYFCAVHPWMTGTVNVSGGDGNNTSKETKSQITLNVIIDTKPDTIQNTVTAYQERFATLKNVLSEKGITLDESKQNQLSFNQFYSGSPGQYSYYSSATDVVIKTDPKNLDELMTIIKNQKAGVQSMVLSISDSALDAARKDLTQKAIDDATKKAEELIDSSGLKIKTIKKIDIDSTPMNQNNGIWDYHGVRLSLNDPSFYQSGQASIKVTIDFEVGK
ncbi:MAG TPA: SIMPL domain-containing protein [Candidatus Nitrosotalea sp.]|nr:SIMPL domain-containing protein [Candidatus Nitrosotalea sp.]